MEDKFKTAKSFYFSEEQLSFEKPAFSSRSNAALTGVAQFFSLEQEILVVVVCYLMINLHVLMATDCVHFHRIETSLTL